MHQFVANTLASLKLASGESVFLSKVSALFPLMNYETFEYINT